MNATQWWAVLLEGAVGAVIGLGGIYLAFRLTVGHERKKAETERLYATAREVLAVFTAFPVYSEDAEPPQEWLRRAGPQLMLFGTLMLRERPALGKWAINEWYYLTQVHAADERTLQAWRDGGDSGPRPEAELPAAAARVAAVIARWHAGELDEAWFKGNTRDAPAPGKPADPGEGAS